VPAGFEIWKYVNADGDEASPLASSTSLTRR
jgi:hypothetical protein